jgi:hypothetical protein
MKTLIDSYQSFPGEHCGSVAMRGLLHHYCGLDLPEDVVFGLGAGLDSVYLSAPGMDPAALFFGRTVGMEVDLGRALEVDYREQSEEDDAQAWQVVREEVLAGRPTMLSGDIFYLDYREYKVHFPAHRFVFVGFDDDLEKAYIADRIRPEPEACSYGALFKSRNPPVGISTHNLWGRFHDTKVKRELPEAARFAIDLCAGRMLGTEAASMGAMAEAGGEVVSGVAGVRHLAERLPEWGARDDSTWVASYNARCIEKFGNGGGNFRRLYTGFLRWARELDASLVPASAPDLCWRAADGWTELSEMLGKASEEDAPAGLWKDASQKASAIADLEQALFESLRP